MRQRSNLIILFGIAFFLIGGALVYLVLDGGPGDTSRQCQDRGGIPARHASGNGIVCIDPSALR